MSTWTYATATVTSTTDHIYHNSCDAAAVKDQLDLESHLASSDRLATLAGCQATQHFEVLQQQQEANHCRLPAI